MRILYTDDDPMLLDITREFLSTNGFEVEVANSAAEALDMIMKSHYDALVSDYQMPNIDGIQLLKHLRAMPNSIPFILFTGKGREEIAIEALNSGADYYLQKGGEPKAQFAELMHHVQMAVERRVAEAQLKESRETFRALVEVIGDWRWEMDARGFYTYCSPQVFDVIGYQPNDMIGKCLFEFLPPDERSRAVPLVLEALRSERKLRQFENERVHKNGSIVYVESSVVPVIDRTQQVIGYRGVDRDVTKKKEMERALGEANHRLEILESVTWHDTMNQLTILAGNVELMRRDPRPDVREKYLKRIELAANSIRNQMDFTKDYQRTGRTKPVWLDVSKSFALAAGMLDTQDVKVICTVSDLEIKSDPMLVKAFFNMIDNSLRYGQKVTEVGLSVVHDKHALSICYSDNGIGIPYHDKDLIFKKGFGTNTGLGMFLIKSILGITNISIKETGTPREGIRLEMFVPEDMFRYACRPDQYAPSIDNRSSQRNSCPDGSLR
jgi:PAS domain S-box-containing protein